MINQAGNWRIRIKKMPNNSQGFFPAVIWAHDPPFCSGGELRTQIGKGALVLKKKEVRVGPGRPNTWRFPSAEKALEKIREFGWEDPPYVEEVFQIMLLVKEGPRNHKLLENVQERWESLINGGMREEIPAVSGGIFRSPVLSISGHRMARQPILD